MITINDVKDFISENESTEEVQSLVNSIADKRVNQAIETYKAKHEQQKLDALSAEIEQLQAEKKTASMRDTARAAGLPDTLLDYAIGETEEETQQKAADLLSSFTDALEKKTEKEVNIRLAGEGPKASIRVDTIDLKNMSAEEISGLSDSEYQKGLNMLNQN